MKTIANCDKSPNKSLLRRIQAQNHASATERAKLAIVKLRKNKRDINKLLFKLSGLGVRLLIHANKQGVSTLVANRCVDRFIKFCEFENKI